MGAISRGQDALDDKGLHKKWNSEMNETSCSTFRTGVPGAAVKRHSRAVSGMGSNLVGTRVNLNLNPSRSHLRLSGGRFKERASLWGVGCSDGFPGDGCGFCGLVSSLSPMADLAVVPAN